MVYTEGLVAYLIASPSHLAGTVAGHWALGSVLKYVFE